ncbi:TPA: Lrp/AsnC family transcriptional regulator, partial [Candidatus Woesearchaeota archaeon]|nr:Lrp/AsnC family transcriptional regulator [Candidatus Woesearchaeota archaeon]
MSNGIKINELDKSILYKLDINGREAISKIATEMGRSKKVIQYRIKRMQKSGLYMKDVLLLDTSKLGYHTYSLYLQLSNMLRIEDIIEYLKKTHQIWGIDKIIGKYQLYTSVYVKSVAELEGVIIDLGTEFGDIISDYRLLSKR